MYRNVKPASPIHTFDPLCEVQSDKASVEITSPFDGIVRDLLVEEGQMAKVGQDLCTIEVADDVAAADDAEPTPSSAASEQSASAGAGYGTPPESVQPSHPPADVANSEQYHTPAPPQAQARRPHPLDPNVSPEARPHSAHKDVLAAPSVRHYARQHGVDLGVIAPGSGKGGRIEKRDVDAFLQRGSTQAAAAQGAHAQTEHPAAQEKEVTIELNRTRWNMWKAMEKVCRSLLSRVWTSTHTLGTRRASRFLSSRTNIFDYISVVYRIYS